jgi:hypothetical protein
VRTSVTFTLPQVLPASPTAAPVAARLALRSAWGRFRDIWIATPRAARIGRLLVAIALVAAVVAELAALDVGHVGQEHDTRRTMPGSR